MTALAAAGLTVLAPVATASAPAVSKACKSLNTLQKELDKVDPSDSSSRLRLRPAERAIGDAFHKAAKSAPTKLKSALNTIGGIYSDMGDADNVAGAVQAFGKSGQKYTKAFRTFSTYLTTNCLGAS